MSSRVLVAGRLSARRELHEAEGEEGSAEVADGDVQRSLEHLRDVANRAHLSAVTTVSLRAIIQHRGRA